jgi:flagellar basal-body rod protein FlgB
MYCAELCEYSARGGKKMIGSNAFNYINVLNKAADASWKRNEVIANNIANNDTPNYKRNDIKFQDYLKGELMKDYWDGGDLNKRVANVDLSKLETTLYTDQQELSYRLDGNNVDINTENANLAENTIMYYTLLDSMSQEFSRIKTVLSS